MPGLARVPICVCPKTHHATPHAQQPLCERTSKGKQSLLILVSATARTLTSWYSMVVPAEAAAREEASAAKASAKLGRAITFAFLITCTCGAHPRDGQSRKSGRW